MPAKDKTSLFTTRSRTAIRDGTISEPTAFFEAKPSHEKEPAAASERFVAVLRTVPIEETLRTGQRDFGHVHFGGDKRLLETLESDWQRYIRERVLKVPTTH